MFCRHCGARIEEGAKFCMKCGTAVASHTQPETKPVENVAESIPEPEEETVRIVKPAEIRPAAPGEAAPADPAAPVQAPLYTPRPASPAPAPAPTNYSANQPNVPEPRKKPIIVLAVLTLITASLSVSFSLLFSLKLSASKPADFLLDYLRFNLSSFLTRFFVPLLIATLFLLFCCLVNKAHVLPAIPPAISFSLGFFSSVANIQGLLGSMNAFRLLLLSTLWSVELTFLVIVIIALAGRFCRTVAGKVLTVVTGIAWLSIEASSNAVSVFTVARAYGAASAVAIIYDLSTLLSLAASILTVIALIRCVFYVAALKRYRESAGGAV